MAWFKKQTETPIETGVTMTVLEQPRSHSVKAETEEYLKEYTELATKAGANVPQLLNECFKRFLNEYDIPVFNLQEVVKYMDSKAKEGKDRS